MSVNIPTLTSQWKWCHRRIMSIIYRHLLHFKETITFNSDQVGIQFIWFDFFFSVLGIKPSTYTLGWCSPTKPHPSPWFATWSCYVAQTSFKLTSSFGSELWLWVYRLEPLFDFRVPEKLRSLGDLIPKKLYIFWVPGTSHLFHVVFWGMECQTLGVT